LHLRVARGVMQLRNPFIVVGAETLVARAVFIVISHGAAACFKTFYGAPQALFIWRIAAGRHNCYAYCFR
jgi:hypothetical protein